MICKQCGEVLSDNSKKCPRCGTNDPDIYVAKNPYAPTQTVAPTQPGTPNAYPSTQGQAPPIPTAYPTPDSIPPKFYGVPVQNQNAPYTPLPYSNPPTNNSYYPVPQVKPNHPTRNLVLAITIPIAAVLIILSILFLSFSQMFASEFSSWSGAKGSDYNPYVTGESTVATGEHVDSQFLDCLCTTEIVLKEFISGDLANNYMMGLGADLSLLRPDEEYAVVRFQVKLLSNSTENDVYYGNYDFYLYDNLSEQYMETPSYDGINPDSIKLSVGQTGEVVIFAVVPKSADLQAVYITEDNYLCFAPQSVI